MQSHENYKYFFCVLLFGSDFIVTDFNFGGLEYPDVKIECLDVWQEFAVDLSTIFHDCFR